MSLVMRTAWAQELVDLCCCLGVMADRRSRSRSPILPIREERGDDQNRGNQPPLTPLGWLRRQVDRSRDLVPGVTVKSY